MEYMHERNAGKVVASRLRAMDSSSAAARDSVSRSESFVRHVKTLCFMFCGEDDIVVNVMVPAEDRLLLRWWSRWNLRQHRR